MGFVNSNGIPDLKKSVISLWFRIPKVTTQSVTDEYKMWLADETSPPPPRRRFLGIIPLITFGPTALKAREISSQQITTGVTPPVITHVYTEGGMPDPCATAHWEDIPPEPGSGMEGGPRTAFIPSFDSGSGPVQAGFDLDGSYIGVDCMGKYPALSINVVMPNAANITGADQIETTYAQDKAWNVVGSGTLWPFGYCPGAPRKGPDLCYTQTHVSAAISVTKQGYSEYAACVPETFRLLPAWEAGSRGAAHVDSADPNYGGIEVKPDEWHHLLLSFDFSNGNVSSTGQTSVTTIVDGISSPGLSAPDTEKTRMVSACKIYLAFDDSNKTGDELSVYAIKENEIGTVNSHYVAHSVRHDVHETGNPTAACHGINQTYDETGEDPTYLFNVSEVDGKNFGLPAHETYSDAVRRVEMAELQVFADVVLDTSVTDNRRAFVDADGYPVVAAGSEGDDDGGDASATDLLGKPAEIVLSGSDSWISGDNTGTLDDFSPTGDIQAWSPDPRLEGSSSSVRLTRKPAFAK